MNTNKSASDIYNIDKILKSNQALKSEYNSLSRNYEAVCLKLNEDQAKISKLEKELSTLKSSTQSIDNTNNEYIQLKSQYEELLKNYDNLESKYIRAFDNLKKYQENEVKYKQLIQKLDEKAKRGSIYENQNLQLKKQNLQQSNLLLEENRKLEEFIKKLKNENNEINIQAKKSNQIYEQMKRENELIYKLLEETRSKLKLNNELIEKLKNIIKDTKNKINTDKYKVLYEEANQSIINLNNEKDNLINELSFYKNLEKSNVYEKYKLYTITHINEYTILSHITNSNINIDKNVFNDIFNNKFNIVVNNIQNNILKKFDDKYNKLQLLQNRLTLYINNNINNSNINNNNNNEEINKLLLQIEDLKLQINKLNNDIKEKDINITQLTNNYEICNKELIKKTEEFNIIWNKCKKSVDIKEVKQLFHTIKEITKRLGITLDSFDIHLQCQSCFTMKNELYQISCGHSLCIDCIKYESKCIVCDHQIDKSNYKTNCYANDVIVKYKHCQQQINSDMNLVINTLDNFFKEDNIFTN